MCGIFGIITNKNSEIQTEIKKGVLLRLLLNSESRGKDASGLALVDKNKIIVYKESLSPSKFKKTNNFRKLTSKASFQSIIGHARMETNGSYILPTNNQPVVNNNIITIHNGIITNDHKIWTKYKDLKRQYQVDTEVFNSLLSKYLTSGNSLELSSIRTFQQIEGAASIASLFGEYNSLLLATNTGSLYTATDTKSGIFLFASEKTFIDDTLKTCLQNGSYSVDHLRPNTGLVVNLDTLKKTSFDLHSNSPSKNYNSIKYLRKIEILNSGAENLNHKFTNNIHNDSKKISIITNKEFLACSKKIKQIKRCTKCILPETMPLIRFDKNGVCNYCLHHKKMVNKGQASLVKLCNKLKKNKDGIDCIVALSGGRDSCFGLHYAKNVLKLNPVSYSYDWGMLTDLGRRNQARMTGKLGVEHILISADIHKKRDNIRKNVEAWLKRPNLGTIPLFMAGDKQYFYYANKLMKQFGVSTLIMSENPLERTHFKTGFCNVGHADSDKPPYFLSTIDKIKLFIFYLKQYILNPSFINSSLIDTFTAFMSFYIIPRNYLYLFDYLKWDERDINSTLINDYNWELSTDTKSTWRIGDGTAPFYNYIYYTVAGFTENDTFRSNQIREGQIDRKTAIRLSTRDNKPRIDSMIWYADTINIDLEKAIRIINTIPKLY